jgi:hypothetical protein
MEINAFFMMPRLLPLSQTQFSSSVYSLAPSAPISGSPSSVWQYLPADPVSSSPSSIYSVPADTVSNSPSSVYESAPISNGPESPALLETIVSSSRPPIRPVPLFTSHLRSSRSLCPLFPNEHRNPTLQKVLLRSHNY